MINHLNIFSKKFVLKTILIMILISMICNNINNYQYNNSKSYTIKVNQEEIENQQIKYIYMITRNQQKQEFSKNFLKIINERKFKEKTYNKIINKLIDEILIKQYAEKLKFNVPIQDINKIISNLPYFQKNNKFDYKTYLNQLQKSGITSYEYKKKLQEYETKEKIIKQLSNSEFILKYEKNFFLNLLSEKKIIKKIKIKKNRSIKTKEINKKESYKYFKKHSNLFIFPEKFKINYIKIQTNQIPINITNMEMKNWYFKNIKNNVDKEKKKYSMIQINSLEQSKKILFYLKKNKSFFNLAKKYSIDPISSKFGGNIGWINNVEENPEIKKIKLKKVNQLSHIVKSKIGYLIFKLNKIKPENKFLFYKIKNKIFKIIKQKKQYLIKKQIEKIIKNYNHETLYNISKKILKKIGKHTIQTNWFDKNDYLKNHNKNNIIQYIFNIKKNNCNNKINKNIQLIKINDNISYIIQIEKYNKTKNKKFKDVQNKINCILQYQKNRNKILEIGKKILLEINNKINDNKNCNFDIKKSIILSKNDKKYISNSVLDLPYPNKEKIISIKEENNGNILFYSLNKVINSKLSDKEKKQIKNYLYQYQKKIILNNLLINLRKQSEIKFINNKYFH